MAIGPDGRFLPNATKAALEVFSATDIARTLHRLDCGLTRDEVALIASTYEKLFTPASVRLRRNGLVHERLMKKVQEVFQAARQVRPVADACERLYREVLEVRDGDWVGLYVRLAVAAGMNPDAAECARAVIQLRREQGKNGEDARFAAEQFADMWSNSDCGALERARDVESILRDITKTCTGASQKGSLEAFKAEDEMQRRQSAKASERSRYVRQAGRR